MCGIGVILDPSIDKVNYALNSFLKTLAHRGPDGKGLKIISTSKKTKIGFAHTRLSIIDLSDFSSQPMLDQTSGNLITFNGEIYNYKELAEELISFGEILQTKSDTEVLLKAYKYFKPRELLCKLRGMFAFAIWDQNKKQIFIARDPCGIKPLYYTSNKGSFACASESKSLVKAGLVDGSLNRSALDSYLSFGSVQAPLNIFNNIKTLLPGHFLYISEDGEISNPINYWQWSKKNKSTFEEIQNNLFNSVKRTLVADTPVAHMLSGGYDSTALASIASELNSDLSTFTLTFPECPNYSEGEAAKKIAQFLNTHHSNIELYQSDFDSILPSFFLQWISRLMTG